MFNVPNNLYLIYPLLATIVLKTHKSLKNY